MDRSILSRRPADAKTACLLGRGERRSIDQDTIRCSSRTIISAGACFTTMHRAIPITVTLVAVLVAGTACGSEPRKSAAAPPWVVCGTTLWNAPSGAAVVDATGSHVTVTAPSAGGYVFLKLGSGCEHGAEFTVVPSSSASVVAEATAADHAVAAVVLRPAVASFDVRVRRFNGRSDAIDIRLGRNFEPRSQDAGNS
jgi:hypothetical protein